ncbi:hypothetical protein TNIN_308291 [Trichonephila inaurata madagascariensis]|uniref:Uncharacterized protein n=1 Tax=Trichonephila inaurata madagascariensis TaxID=2747483 RepID=A0A8X7CDR9_9ARAC|nr:hypothetical protein TNIN_308291 [Trichonephila inaurata madagascariensis]
MNILKLTGLVYAAQKQYPREKFRTTDNGQPLIFGIIFIGITFAVSNVDSILQVNIVFLSLGDCPVFAVFLFAALTRKVSDKSAMIGFILGTIFIGFIGFGIISGGYKYPSLPIETSGYEMYTNVTTHSFMNSTVCSSWGNCTSSDISNER